MNIRLYYPNSIVENTTILLSKEHTHYLTNVMRLKRGSFVNFFNKEGEWKSEIVFLEKVHTIWLTIPNPGRIKI